MKKYNKYLMLLFIPGIFALTALLQSKEDKNKMMTKIENRDSSARLEKATLGAGCFWCVEAIFQELNGVVSVSSGYSGGNIQNPSYEDVCSGKTGHAEVCQILFDPKKITFDELLEVFWSVHDPTTLNRQGSDVGTQYRSVIFYHNPRQKEIAEKYKKKLNDEHAFENRVVTEIASFREFYKAEEYHQNYFSQNSDKPYCALVIRPKVEKFEKIFNSKIHKVPEGIPSEDAFGKKVLKY